MTLPIRLARGGRAVGLLLVLALAATLLVGCAEDGDDGAAATNGTAVTVSGSAYDPGSLTVPVGTTVTWTNEDGVGHTVTAGEPDAPADTFDESLDGSGGTASVTFDEAGTFDYFCRFHPRMTATVVVE